MKYNKNKAYLLERKIRTHIHQAGILFQHATDEIFF